MGTSISISENIGDLTGFALNIAELEKNTEYTKLAFCSKIELGTTQDGKVFFKLQLFDKFGHSIIGRLFNIENVESKGVTANNLKGRVVKIKFDLSTFGGSNSLRLVSIDPVAENVISREEFIGEIPGVIDDVSYIDSIARDVCSSYKLIGNLIMKYQLMSGIESVTIPELYAERKGGAVKFTAKFVKMVLAAFDDTEFNNGSYVKAVIILTELFMYWKYAANYEEDIMSLGDNINTILAKSDKYLDAVLNKANEVGDIEELNICKESKHLLKCYFGYDKPRTYLALTLTGIRETLFNKLKYQEENESMLAGTYKTISVNGKESKIVKLNVR